MRGKARGQLAFTLVEILVALVLASAILAGALYFMNVQIRSHRDALEVQTIQMGLRVGLEQVLRDVRSASAGFSNGTVSIQDGPVVTATGLSTLPAVYLGPSPTSNASNTGAGGSDELSLIFADGRGVTNTTMDSSGVVTQQTTPQTISVLDVRGFTATYPDNFVLISNARDAILVRVTAVSMGSPGPGGTLTIGAMSTASPFPGGIFPGGSLVLTAQAVTYRIDTTVFGTNEPALVRVRGGPLGITGYADPLATQIEDFQVALGYDGLGGGTTEGLITENAAAGPNLDEWAFNVVGDTQTGAITALRAIRVTLVGRSVAPRSFGHQPLNIEDHTPSGTETYMRRRLTGVASVRNLAL